LFAPSVGVEHFLMDLSEMHVFEPSPSVVVHIFDGVCMILILKHDSFLNMGQQSLTKLNTKTSSICIGFSSWYLAMLGIFLTIEEYV